MNFFPPLWKKPEATVIEWELEGVLFDTDMRAAFRDHLAAQMAEESLDFLTATDGPYLHRLDYIIQTFIVGTGNNPPINIAGVTRKQILDEVAHLRGAGLRGAVNYRRLQTAIVAARGECRALIEHNFLAAFRNSDAYREVRDRRAEMGRALGL